MLLFFVHTAFITLLVIRFVKFDLKFPNSLNFHPESCLMMGKGNEYKFGFKIEACLTPFTRDLLMSLAGQQAQHSTRCIQLYCYTKL